MHYKLYMTAAQIKALASNPNHDAHLFLWSDGAQDWTLDALADALTHEALEGMGEESTITLEMADLSDAGRALYIQGFCDHAPKGYDGHKDMAESPCPWCAPFSWYGYWRKTFCIAAQEAAYDPYNMGRLDAENCHAELSHLIREEAESQD